MSAALQILPSRLAGAAENMALDFLLLQRHPQPDAACFRHYDWMRPAFTFGYSQRLEFVRSRLPHGESLDLCRRPTGGGLVDHREDWTYSLVIPRGHPLEQERASQIYRLVHEAIATALRGQGVDAVTKPRDAGDAREDATSAGICFEKAEVFDVVHRGTGAKIAGAAQKRNRRGLLMQGSIWRPAAGAVVDWDRFHEELGARLAELLDLPAEPAPWPGFNEDEVSGLIERYASPEWLEQR